MKIVRLLRNVFEFEHIESSDMKTPLRDRIARRLLRRTPLGRRCSMALRAIGFETASRYTSRFSGYVPDVVSVTQPMPTENGAAPVVYAMNSANGDDVVVRNVWSQGVDSYEAPLPRVFRTLSTQASSVFVVGANTGFYVLQAASSGANVRVHAFEPYPRALELLNGNVELNKVQDRVTVWPNAVGESNGTCPLLIPQPRFGTVVEMSATLSEEFIESIGRDVSTIDVPVITIDQAAERCGEPPDVLLIDVEGFELPVLRGALSTLQQATPYVIVEVIAHRSTSVEHLDQVRASLGYICYEVARTRIIPRASVGDCRESRNQIWVHRSKEQQFAQMVATSNHT